MIEERWGVGFNDRGHGHGDYAVILDNHEGIVVVKTESLELAQHIVKLHNDNLEKGK